MTANGTGGATSKVSQKATRAAPALIDSQSKAKPAQQARESAEAATVPNEEATPSGTLKARGAAVYNAEWTPHEQAALDQAAVKFPAERFQPFERYVRIAATLPRKGVRDVALRLRWLSQARKRKVSEEGPNKRLRRDRCQSIFATQQKAPNVMGQWPQQQLPMPQLDDHGAQTVGAVGGLVAQLLEQNLHILYQYKQNMHQFKVQENTELLVRFRDNILAVLNQMNSMDGVMSLMPPLPVRMNVELANNFLPAASGTSPMFPLGMPGMPPGMGNMAPSPVQPMTGYTGAEPVMGAVASMPSAAGQFAGQQQPQQLQPQQHSSSMPPQSGGIVKAGPPVSTPAAAAATAATAVGIQAAQAGQAKLPAQSASSSKGGTKGTVKQLSPQNSPPNGPDAAPASAPSSAGLQAVASAVSAGKPASSAVNSAAQPATVCVASKPQSAASKSLAASASKVAAGMANKAASAKSNKQSKPKT